jgi:hypothetical protein
VASDFPEESRATVLSLLDGYQGPEKARVLRCVLQLAGGHTDRLLEVFEQAKTDYRDVLYEAEYDAGDHRVRDLGRPFSAATADAGEDSRSFVGGQPFLAPGAEMPACTLCSARMCFSFQVALPAGHRWHGALVAMFQCISCCSEESLVPEMLSAPLRGATIPPGFLRRFQTNFRIVVSDATSARLRDDYEPLIPHRPMDQRLWRIGAEPHWLTGDETPGSYESFADPTFLFQVPLGTVFPIQPSAPPQKTLDLSGQPVDSDQPHYELFLGNAVYFFGFGKPATDRVYVVTQVD